MSPEEIQDWKKHLPSSSHQIAGTPCGEPWGNIGCENTGYWPQIAQIHTEEWFQWAKNFAFSLLRKVLNSLTRDIWYSSIINNLLMFQITYPLLKYCCFCCCLDAKSNQTLCDLTIVTHQAPLSMGFPRQEYWSRLPFASPEDLLNPESNPSPALAGRFFTAEPPGKPLIAKYPSYIAYVFSSCPGLTVVSHGSL